MERSRLAFTLMTAAVIATGCAAQQLPAMGAATGPSAASTAPPSLTGSSSPASTAPPALTGSSSAAADAFLRLARTAYPARSSAALTQHGVAICTALRRQASVHDEVNMLAGQLDNQPMADQLVQAAIGAFCPDLKR